MMHTIAASSLAMLLLLPGLSLAEDLTGGREAKFLNKRGAKNDKALIEFVREAIARRIGENERRSERIAEVEAQLRGKDEEF